MRRIIPLICTVALLAFASLGLAQVATDPVGFITTSCLANSDTYIGVPFTRPPEFTGNIASASGNVLTISGSPGWTVNQWTIGVTPHKTYFALIGPHATSNPNEGRTYKITANDPTTLTVTVPAGDTLANIQANTQVIIIPYWTLATVFPSSDAGVSFVVSPNPIARQTQILIPDYSGSGINLSATTTYFYSGTAWHTTADTAGDHGDDTFLPYNYFILRNAGTGTTLTRLGGVLTKKQTIPLLTSTSHKTDNFVSVTRPIDVSLNNMGLITSGAFASSPNAIALTDQLFVFNNAVAGINKSAAATYFYSGGMWHTTADTSGDHGNDLIPAGSGIIIRKGTTGAGAPQFWLNTPTY
jgi:uncharacterized protein (TIGR02597 family)